MSTLPKTLLIVVILTASLLGCNDNTVKGDNKMVTEQRQAQPFTDIAIKGHYVVRFEKSATPELHVRSDSNVLPFIKTEVKDKVLLINNAGKEFKIKKIPAILIKAPELNSVVIGGKSKFDAKDLDSNKLTILAKGDSKVTLKGRSANFNLFLHGNSVLMGKEFKASTAKLQIKGKGTAEVRVSQLLKIDINGDGKVIYHGFPKRVLERIVGKGVIQAAVD